MAESYKFIVGKHTPSETWKRPGKSEWQNLLRIEIGRDGALELAESLIRQARLTRGDDLVFSLPGELSEDPNE